MTAIRNLLTSDAVQMLAVVVVVTLFVVML